MLYVLSCNLCEILTIFLAPVIGFPIPLLPIHILWINLATDGLPGIALVAEPAEKNIMQRPPHPPDEKLFSGGLVRMILLSALVMTAATLSVQWWARKEGYTIPVQQTMVFTTLCLVQLGNALSVRSVNRAVFSSHIFSNKGMWMAVLLTIILQLLLVYFLPLHSIFHTAYLSLPQMAAVVSLTLGSMLFIELLKLVSRKKNRDQAK